MNRKHLRATAFIFLACVLSPQLAYSATTGALTVAPDNIAGFSASDANNYPYRLFLVNPAPVGSVSCSMIWFDTQDSQSSQKFTTMLLAIALKKSLKLYVDRSTGSYCHTADVGF